MPEWKWLEGAKEAYERARKNGVMWRAADPISPQGYGFIKACSAEDAILMFKQAGWDVILVIQEPKRTINDAPSDDNAPLKVRPIVKA